jgi:rifampicin phosphotransferase
MTVISPPPVEMAAYTEAPKGYWERSEAHFPLPVTPFSKVVLMQEWLGQQVAAEMGSLIERMEFAEIGGWVYQRVVPLGGKDRKPPPEWLLPVLLRTVPALRKRIATSVDVIRTDWAGRLNHQGPTGRPERSGSARAQRC